MNLAVHAVGQNIIADDVVAAVVLVVSARLHAIDQVVFQHNAGTPFVIVQTPTTSAVTVVRIDVVDNVVADRGPFSQSQRVNASHITQDAPAQVMDMIELNHVVGRDGGCVAPTPTNRNTGVEVIADVVVSHLIVPAVANPHANRTVVDAGSLVNDIVVTNDMAGLRVGFG